MKLRCMGRSSHAGKWTVGMCPPASGGGRSRRTTRRGRRRAGACTPGNGTGPGLPACSAPSRQVPVHLRPCAPWPRRLSPAEIKGSIPTAFCWFSQHLPWSPDTPRTVPEGLSAPADEDAHQGAVRTHRTPDGSRPAREASMTHSVDESLGRLVISDLHAPAQDLHQATRVEKEPGPGGGPRGLAPHAGFVSCVIWACFLTRPASEPRS